MSYATEFYEYIKQNNIKKFTHRDILIQTDTNCSYSVLSDLKRILFKNNMTLKETSIERVNKKGKKRIFIEYEIIKNCDSVTTSNEEKS